MLPADIRIDRELPRDRIVLNVSRECLLFAAPIAHGGSGWCDADGRLHARYGTDHPRVDAIRPDGPDGYPGLACNTPDLMPMIRCLVGLLQHA
ncbi:MAG: hypothetical protein GDA49_00225 [Rhodospirillales bacterium]|nr:hypothetical protein [Rhodospirillales bacterium]